MSQVLLRPLSPWLLVFDLDGTLIDSSLDLCLAVNAALLHVGAEQLPHSVIAGYIGDGAAMLVRRALGDPADPDCTAKGRTERQERFQSAFEHFLAFYREHKLDNTHVYEGVLDALAALRTEHPMCPMAVLTNKPVRPSREICEALGIAPFLFANYGGDSFGAKKPDPEGLLHLMYEAREQWRQKGFAPEMFPPSGVIVIGDSEVDVLTAKRVGAMSLGCRYGLAPASLLAAAPDFLCDSATEWPALIQTAASLAEG